MGDNIAFHSDRMEWYDGMTVLQVLDSFENIQPSHQLPFRMPVQGVYKFTAGGDMRRIIAGTVDSGSLRAGDEVVFYPSGKRTKVKRFEAFNAEAPTEVQADDAVGFTMEEEIYVRRARSPAGPAKRRRRWPSASGPTCSGWAARPCGSTGCTISSAVPKSCRAPGERGARHQRLQPGLRTAPVGQQK